MVPTTPAGVQQYPRKEFHQPSVAAWVGRGRRPRELGKRWPTRTDRQVLAIGVPEAVATLGIAHTYSFVFQCHYDRGLNQLLYDFDHDQLSMR